MDPNDTLSELEDMIVGTAVRDAERFTELCTELYAWIRRGGFAPSWADYPNATSKFRQWQRRRALIEVC